MSQRCGFRAHQQWSSSFRDGGLVSQLSNRKIVHQFEDPMFRDSVLVVRAEIAEADETISYRVDNCYGGLFVRYPVVTSSQSAPM